MNRSQVIQCPHCRNSLQVQLDLPTSNFVCPNCNNPFSFQQPAAGNLATGLPSSTSANPGPGVGGAQSAQTPKSPNAKSGKSAVLISVVVVAAVLITISSIGGIAWYVYSNNIGGGGSSSKAKQEEEEFLRQLKSATLERQDSDDSE